MKAILKQSEIDQYLYQDTSFNILMKKRIQHVLLICSNYDAFILEEDGRINEKVFEEYVSLNLRYPPAFYQVNSAESAFELLATGNIDLVITMLSISDSDPFVLSKDIKYRHPEIPIVVLTPFSREVSQRLAQKDLSAVDYVFAWLGNTSLLLGIIKLIEDKMNAEHDIMQVGVQAILVVEDSVRYYSSFLPNIYRYILSQSNEFVAEALNDHQRMLRLRGRPKLLLATNFEEAINLFDKYQRNILGVITDVSFNRDGSKDPFAGVKLCEAIKERDPLMPLLMQSTDSQNEIFAKELKIKFLNKNSKVLSLELRDFILEYFAFGDFIFRDPATGKEVARAKDLRSIRENIRTIPDATLKYHIERNHFSKWLRARALFTLADLFRRANSADFNSLVEVREYIVNAINRYLTIRAKGIIASFNKDRYHEFLTFTRMGDGSLGGKARGLAFIDMLIKKHKLTDKYTDTLVNIPRTVAITTEYFDLFMEKNNLFTLAFSDAADDVIFKAFIDAELPEQLVANLKVMLSINRKPLAIRSSSMLEDSHYQPFAGIYSTYMIPYIADEDRMLELLGKAIKSVYASVYFHDSKAYIQATSNVIDEEKMAVVIQEVCGNYMGDYYFPTISGVSRSLNFYPVGPEKAEHGIVNLAYGLGKYVVDGGVTLRFSPFFPEKVIQLSSPDMALSNTQTHFFALKKEAQSFSDKADESLNLELLPFKNGIDDPGFKYVASTYNRSENRIIDSLSTDGIRLATFARILKYDSFPLCDIMKDIQRLAVQEMGNQVEIEFAGNLAVEKGEPKVFSLLQIRPIVDNKESINIDHEQINERDSIAICHHALGNGVFENIYDVVFINNEYFDPSKTTEIAAMLEKINISLVNSKRPYILIGPGRWGSSDPWLGIPVKWSQISGARVIIETTMKKFNIDPSQGTHFFQNLTSLRVAYFTINQAVNEGFIDYTYLNRIIPEFQNLYIRHVRFSHNVFTLIDGKKSTGVILKPGIQYHKILKY